MAFVSKTNRKSSAFRLTLNHIWVAAALILLMLRPLLTAIPPNDFWWHMATGRAIVQTGAIPQLDTFSFTRAGEPFFNQSWLAQVLLFTLYQLGGIELIFIVQALVIGLAYGLLLWLCVRLSGRLRLSVVLLLLATMPLSFDNWTVRPQSYVFPLFVGFMMVLTEYRLGHSRRLWLLPLMMLLWVNMHGSFVLGLVLIGLTVVGMVVQRFRQGSGVGGQGAGSVAPQDIVVPQDGVVPQDVVVTQDVVVRQDGVVPLIIWGAITALAMLVNPQGLNVLGYVRNLLGSNQVTSLVVEWAPPSIRDTSGLIFFLFLLLCFLVLIYARSKPDPSMLLMFLAFLWLALGAVRNIVWFGFVATPLLVMQASSFFRQPAQRTSTGSTALNAVLLSLLLVLLFLGLPWIKPAIFPAPSGDLLDPNTPVAAVEVLQRQDQRPKRLFHAMAYGSYLIWAAPEQPVFIDPRIELYPLEQWLDYIRLTQGLNVEQIVDRYNIDGMLLDKKEQSGLLEVLANNNAWEQYYTDEQTVLVRRVR